MNEKYTYYLRYACISSALAAALALGGCSSGERGVATQNEAVAANAQDGQAAVSDGTDETIAPLGMDGQILPGLDDVELPEDAQAAPQYLREGVRHEIVKKLQQRLMDLGFMDNDEPTDYFGQVTLTAVKHFQRQNELPQDGIVGDTTWNELMADDAKHYAVSKGTQGDDIQKIQQRLYELGYLASADQVTGNFDDATETAVLKLQGVNGLAEDGKVGQQTYNLMYSDDIKANMLAYGEKSDVVLACQQRLKDLGYLTTTPDGTYGQDTVIAVKQFQARNDQVVDGYLGPSTRIVLNSSDAKPNGLMIGEQGDSVTRVQQLLSKYGYLPSSNVTGYYGEATEDAVKNFQSRNGLSADGKVGVQTMAKLTSDNVKKPAPTTAASTKSNKSNSSSNKNNSSSKGNSGGNASSPAPRPAAGVSALISVASSKLGSPYVWGAKGPSSFDCSGFVCWVFSNSGVHNLPRTTAQGIYNQCTPVSAADAKAGDIIFFTGTYNSGVPVSHVGIYCGNGVMIHCGDPISYASINSSYWQSHFYAFGRLSGN